MADIVAFDLFVEEVNKRNADGLGSIPSRFLLEL